MDSALSEIRVLLPAPDAYAAGRGGSQHPDTRRGGGHAVSLADVTEHALMPTPRATRGGSSTELAYNLGGSRSDEDRSQGRVLLPTPQVADATGGHATRSGARSDEKLLPGVAVEAVTDWGPYAPAVERWERITRPAPSPVRMDGKGGRARLSPELPEWMMGWPAGWVTDPAIGLSRAAQLKAAGNGVCPQQAAAALREMLARPGVPAIEWGLAA
jgi:DNA (cytosine-5)-methyltransferase 1